MKNPEANKLCFILGSFQLWELGCLSLCGMGYPLQKDPCCIFKLSALPPVVHSSVVKCVWLLLA